MMERIIHDLTQGSDAWHQFRLDHFGASEAAAMLGLSQKTTRTELLRMKHTGIAKEFSDWVQENILDYGHEVEAKARPLVEVMLGEDLYPAIYSFGKLSASCDGLTMDGSAAFEHKQWNTELAAAVARAELPEEYQPQCQQIMLATGAERVIFAVSDGTAENFAHMEVLPDQAWIDRIIAGWKQFAIDLDNYQPVEVIPAPMAAPTKDLPALSIQVNGSISLISNLDKFGTMLNQFVEGIDKEPKDDQGFANAEAAIKTLEKAQNALEQAESSALAQTSSIDEMRRTVKLYADTARTARLMLEKMVKARKESIRIEIQQRGKDACTEHFVALNKRLGKPYMPTVSTDFAGVMKGKKTIASLNDAVDTEIARFKIAANDIADKIQTNLESLRELAADHAFLFADTANIVQKDNDDLVALIKLRIADHKEAEAKRLEAEREKIRQEEQAKAEAKVKAEQEAKPKCDGNHGGPRCGDPECWNDTPSLAEVVHAAAPAAIAEAIAPRPAVLHTPQAVQQDQPKRPTRAEIIATIALQYGVSEQTAHGWLRDEFQQKAA